MHKKEQGLNDPRFLSATLIERLFLLTRRIFYLYSDDGMHSIKEIRFVLLNFIHKYLRISQSIFQTYNANFCMKNIRIRLEFRRAIFIEKAPIFRCHFVKIPKNILSCRSIVIKNSASLRNNTRFWCFFSKGE